MNPTLRRALTTVLCLLGTASAGRSAQLSSGADFLLVTTGARPVGLGGAFSAQADDINALNSNPAGLSFLQMAEVGYGRYQSFADIHHDFLAAAVPFGKAGVFALGYLGMGMTPFNSTGDPLAISGSASHSAFLVAWGRSFHPRFRAGAEVKLLSWKVSDLSGSGFATDLGVIFRPMKSLSVGVAGQNLGPDMTMEGSEPLPSLMRIGVTAELLTKKMHQLNLSVENSLNLVSRLPTYGMGAEYWYRAQFAARAGYVGNADTENLTLGAGIKLSGFQLDYAFQPYDMVGSTHRVSGIYRFEVHRKRASASLRVPEDLVSKPIPDGLEIQWKAPAGGPYTYQVTVARSGAAPKTFPNIKNTSIRLIRLQPNSGYSVRIQAVDAAGVVGAPSQSIQFQTSAGN